jgi:hypothetical protein
VKFSPNNFLMNVKNIVTGGKAVTSASESATDSGFWRDIVIPLGAVDWNTVLTVDTSDAGGAADPVLYGGAYLTADETNARVAKVEEAIDSIGHLTFPVPRDYDEATDVMKVRVLASMLTVSTDDDVELDSEVYVKTAGSALGSDLNPTAPGTVLSTTETWLEFDLTGNSLERDDVITFELITNGANDTDGEEVLIHAVQVSYRSTLVSYDKEDASGNPLR